MVNIVNSALLEKMNVTSASIAIDKSEFDLAQVEQSNSCKVAALSVAESPIRYECTLREINSVSDLPAGGNIILLDVKSVYVRDDLYSDGGINQELIDSVGKMGGDGYSHTSHYVSLNRP